MVLSEKPQFMKFLSRTFAAYGKQLPEPSILSAWWETLERFPLPVVDVALRSYVDENGEFEPKPAGIAKRCKLMDGRPSDDEAWAIALTSRNEEDTIVWTSETAEAFAICAPVLQVGDEVGARMAFKDAYKRLVAAARLAGKPAAWSASLGWDKNKREEVLSRAVTAGFLPAPTSQALLPNHSNTVESSPQGLKRLKEEMAKLKDGWAKAADRRAVEVAEKREAEAQRKRELGERCAAYEKNVIPMRASACAMQWNSGDVVIVER
jgi:hypothetical protein